MATESSENNYNEGTRFFESTYRMIVDDLIDEAILEVCFEVHHAAKWGYLDLEYPKLAECQVSVIPEEIKADPRAEQLEMLVICPVCIKKVGATEFAKHLASCMGLVGSTARASSKLARQKIADSGAFINEPISRKEGTKKKKNNVRKKANSQGSSKAKVTDLNINYNEMTSDQIQEFFNQKCGVLTRTSTMCAKTLKCSHHTDEERDIIRRTLLKSTNEQIDVDTLDVNADFSFMTETASALPSQENHFL